MADIGAVVLAVLKKKILLLETGAGSESGENEAFT